MIFISFSYFFYIKLIRTRVEPRTERYVLHTYLPVSCYDYVNYCVIAGTTTLFLDVSVKVTARVIYSCPFLLFILFFFSFFVSDITIDRKVARLFSASLRLYKIALHVWCDWKMAKAAKRRRRVINARCVTAFK